MARAECSRSFGSNPPLTASLPSCPSSPRFSLLVGKYWNSLIKIRFKLPSFPYSLFAPTKVRRKGRVRGDEGDGIAPGLL